MAELGRRFGAATETRARKKLAGGNQDAERSRVDQEYPRHNRRGEGTDAGPAYDASNINRALIEWSLEAGVALNLAPTRVFEVGKRGLGDVARLGGLSQRV
jgi:hypothetical protein